MRVDGIEQLHIHIVEPGRSNIQFALWEARELANAFGYEAAGLQSQIAVAVEVVAVRSVVSADGLSVVVVELAGAWVHTRNCQSAPRY